jgi:hypothetical protein
VDEDACPFCAAALADSFRASVGEARVPPSGLSRAALYAFGVGAVTAACSQASSTPLYGAPFVGEDAAVRDAAGEAGEAGQDGGQVMALYGGPPVDAAAPDVGPDAIMPLYGAPFIDGGSDGGSEQG